MRIAPGDGTRGLYVVCGRTLRRGKEVFVLQNGGWVSIICLVCCRFARACGFLITGCVFLFSVAELFFSFELESAVLLVFSVVYEVVMCVPPLSIMLCVDALCCGVLISQCPTYASCHHISNGVVSRSAASM